MTSIIVLMCKILINKEYFRVADDCTSKCDPLLLCIRNIFDLFMKNSRDSEELCRSVDTVVDDISRKISQPETKSHIFIDIQIFIKQIILECHCQFSVAGKDIVEQFIAKINLS